MLTIVACVAHLVTTAVLFHSARLVLRVLVPVRDSRGRPWRLMAEEFVSTMDFCSGCCELAFVYDNYGVLPFGSLLFVLCLWWCWSFGDAAANPNKYVEDGIQRYRSWRQVGYLICSQLLAAILVSMYMKRLWSVGWSSAHAHKSQEKECYADLQVPVVKGALVEGFITFVDRLNALTLEEVDWPHSTLTSAALATTLVITALNSSGGYFNPVLATALKFGCKGHNAFEFFMVYWIGSALGSLLALTFHNLISVKKLLQISNLKTD